MRKQCKRKVWALVNPINHVLEGIATTPKEYLDRLRIRELAAIESFRTGSATLQDWTDISNMMNLTEVMAKNGVGIEALEVCQQAQSALIESAHRYEQTKKMGTTGQGLQAMRELFEYHDLQRASISRGEYEKHIQATINRIKSRSAEVVEL